MVRWGTHHTIVISVQDLLMPLGIKPKMTKAERSNTTLAPTLTSPVSL